MGEFNVSRIFSSNYSRLFDRKPIGRILSGDVYIISVLWQFYGVCEFGYKREGEDGAITGELKPARPEDAWTMKPDDESWLLDGFILSLSRRTDFPLP